MVAARFSSGEGLPRRVRAAADQMVVVEQLAEVLGLVVVIAGELDALVAHLRDLGDRARQVLRALAPDGVKLQADRDLLPFRHALALLFLVAACAHDGQRGRRRRGCQETPAGQIGIGRLCLHAPSPRSFRYRSGFGGGSLALWRWGSPTHHFALRALPTIWT